MTDQLHRLAPPAPLAPVLPPHHHAAHNGRGALAVAAGAVGVVSGAIPFLFPLAAVCGALALVLGVSALRRVRRGEATNGSSAGAAVTLGVIALVLAFVGCVVSVVATADFVPPPAGSASSPAAPRG